MRTDNNTPKIGIIVVLCAAVGAIWPAAVYGTYKENQYPKYDVRVSPGAVSYGTRSSATMPTVSAPLHRSAVPMISGSDVRSYVHNGHASYPQHHPAPYTIHHTPYTIHTTPSATVHTFGSGGRTGGGGVSSPLGDRGASPLWDRGASSHGITYGGGAVSMPVLAVNSSLLATSPVSAAEASAPRAIGPRRVKDNGDGTYDGEYDGEYNSSTGEWWSDEAEGWVDAPFPGCKKYDSTLGYMVEWNGTEWVKVKNQTDPTNPTPLGDMPWIGMLLLVLGYGTFKAKKQVRL